MVDQEVEEWRTHQMYMVEGPKAAEINTIYKRINYAKELNARKWIQEKEKGWKIIIDHISLDIERDLQRIPGYEGWVYAGQGSSSIAMTTGELILMKS